MRIAQVGEYLWGEHARLRYLLLAAGLLLLTFLESRELWTHEYRWADIVSNMFARGDFLHPYLGERQYYDKPLLSYWLIAVTSKIFGGLSTFTLRLPSVGAGLVAIYAIYRLGYQLKDKTFGLLAGWLLLTTFYFVFWARTSSADMLNLAGSILAVSWYFDKREQPTFINYFVFFLIITLTSLCKGLIGAIVPMIAVSCDLILRKSWRHHWRWSLFVAMGCAGLIYLAPFIASAYFNGTEQQNGLYLVYRENVLRYFQPFDHQGNIYLYLIYLPIYTLPWALFFIPAIILLPRRWQNLELSSRWLCYTLLAIFIFFSLSGSRRSYYVLPMVPFAVLFIADWIRYALAGSPQRERYLGVAIIIMFFSLFTVFDLIIPCYYHFFGLEAFVTHLKKEAEKIRPWSSWNMILLNPEAKMDFYLQTPRLHTIRFSEQELLKVTQLKTKNTIFVSQKRYVATLNKRLPDYRMIELPRHYKNNLDKNNITAPIAFIPNHKLAT